MNILIISPSLRDGRGSHRIALFWESYLEKKGHTPTVLDLKAKNYPLFHERLKHMSTPSDEAREISKLVSDADGVILIVPEYNGGYPASLKNIIDLLGDEWHHKPIGIATVSAGAFGGLQSVMTLIPTLWKLGATVINATFVASPVQTDYSEDGTPVDREKSESRADKFLTELVWHIEKNH